MSEEFVLNFTVKSKQFADYVKLSRKQSISIWRAVLAWVLTILFLLIYGADAFAGIGPSKAVLSFLVGLVILSTVYCFPAPKYVDKDGSFLGAVTLKTDADGLHWRHENGLIAHYPWKIIRSIRSTKSTLIVFVDRAMGMAIPLDAFASEDERLAFVHLVKNQAGIK